MKSKLEIGFILIILVVFISIIVSGLAINRKLSASIEEVNHQYTQDKKVKLAKEVNQQLIEAENLVYSFNLTRNEAYLKSYYSTNSLTTRKINQLYVLTKQDTFYKPLIDSLNAFSNLKIKNLGRVLMLQNQYRVSDALNLIQDKANEIKQIKQDEKKKFTLFKKNPEKNLTPEEIRRKNYEIYNFKSQLNEIRDYESSKEMESNAEQFSLIQENKLLMKKINRVVQRLEFQERKFFEAKTTQAKQASGEVRLIVLVFSTLSTLLLLFALYIIYRYIVKNNKYQQYLSEAKKESEELAASKARFLSNMSHEIRTPLNAIIGFSNLLQTSDLSSNEEVKERIEIINKSSKHLAKIINEVLDFSKLESNKMKGQEVEFNPKSEIEEVLKILEISAQEKNNKLELSLSDDLPDLLIGDPLKLKQILFNLIGNAIKFTENGKISCQQLPSTSSKEIYTFKMKVRDNGIGISKAYVPKIFEEFIQDESHTHGDKTGTGLGLTITKLLIELLGGNISVESEEGEGSAFTFEVPFKFPSSANGIQALEITQAQVYQKSVLIVDDEPYNRMLIQGILREFDCVITEAANGQVALDLMSKNNFDLVLLDLKMPLMNGYEFVEELKKQNYFQTHQVKIIAISASEIDDEEKFFHGFLLKPIDKKMLIHKIDRVFTNNQTPANILQTEAMKPETPDKLFDLNQLKIISNGDVVFYKDMIQTLIRTSEEGVDELREAFNTHDLEQVAELAHKLSSQFKHIDALLIYNQLKQIEKKSKTMEINLLGSKISNIEEQVGILIGHLNREL